MTEKKHCILSEKHRTNCATCPPICSHRIALHGLDGAGGRVAASNLPEGYSYLTLSKSPVIEAQARIYRLLNDYTATFDRQFDEKGERIKSLYLFSESPGTGKTTTASALINEWIAAHYIGSIKRGQKPEQMPAYFLDVNEWQTRYNEFNRPRVPDSVAEPAAKRYYSAMEKARLVSFAVLDDIGVRETASDAFKGDLHAIINYRVANEKPTVFTSNLPLKSNVREEDKVRTLKPYDIEDVFDARLYDRIRDQCIDLHFEGKSGRGRR